MRCVAFLCVCFFLISVSSISAAEDESVIKLIPPSGDSTLSVMEALRNRHSTREFAPTELSKEMLSDLLWAATGINRINDKKLTAPTACNWQEIDVFVAMKKGLFVYDKSAHALKKVSDLDIRESVGIQTFTQEAPIGLIYVADYSKMTGDEIVKKFYAATDTGYVSQNVYLFCASEGLATVVLGMVNKEELREKMGLREDQFIVLTQPVGYPKE